MGTAASYRIDVVERRFNRLEVMAAVDAPAAAVAHRGALERALVVPFESRNAG
jgi:hypothetical protein